MRIHGSRVAGFLIVAAGLLLLGSVQSVQTEQAGARVEIDGDDIGGVVTGPNGPEAGVWVVAETTDLPTKFSRSVVTDDQGRYVIPDLPDAGYQVWVRGYGLVDSPRQSAAPGQSLDLDAVPAPSEAAAAEYYPAAYWLALMDKPIAGCGLACHQIGNKLTREIPVSIREKTATSLEAWDMRVAAGPEGASMAAAWRGLGDDREAFAEWTDRIAAGELPPDKPPRPEGLERNLVVTVYDWGTKFDGRTDAVASDLRDGTVNPHGGVYMVARSDDILTILDPVENSFRNLIVPSESPVTRDNTPWSPYWGDEPVWRRQSEPRSLAMDSGGRAWLSAIVREAPRQNPEFCTSPENKYAEFFPLTSRSRRALPRQASLYEPETGEFTSIGDVCTSLDHNQFGPDDYMYFGSRDVVFWIDTPRFLETRNTEESVGWCPAVVDTNGDGEITQGWTEPDEPIDPTRDHRVALGCYQIAVDLNDPDGVTWCGDADGSWTLRTTRGRLTRLVKGPDPPRTCRAEVFTPPEGLDISGGPHAAVDSEGVVWMNWRGSQHFTSFDYRKCNVTPGPEAATGELCKDAWTVYRKGGPNHIGTNVEADNTYLPQVDLHNVLGLGADTPLYGTTNYDALQVLLPETGQFIQLRVPYPMGFFSRSANGRVDDATTGWKGKSLWSSFSTYTPWHVEGEYSDGGDTGNGSKAVRFQMRPHPLAH